MCKIFLDSAFLWAYHDCTLTYKNQIPIAGRGYVLKPSSNQNVVFDSGTAPEESGDIVVDSSLRTAYAIWKDGSRRRLNREQTVSIVAEVKRRIQVNFNGSQATEEAQQ